MNTTLLIIALLSNTELEHSLLRLGALMLFGLSLSLTTILWALRAAPEGYEDENGFHFEPGSPSIRHSAGVAILRPRHAG